MGSEMCIRDRFVAVAEDGTNQVMTSPDGINWTAQAEAVQASWVSVTFGNGLFVSVAPNTTNRVMTASAQDELIVTLNGNASSHVNADDVANITFTFADSAFVTNPASAVQNATGPASSNLGIDFNDPASITYSGTGFIENIANDGSVSGSITAILTRDNFAAGPLSPNTDVTLGNVPAGLTPSLTPLPPANVWTAQTAAEQNQWNSVTHCNGLFVAVSSASDDAVMTSSDGCLLYTSPSPRDLSTSRMPSSA